MLKVFKLFIEDKKVIDEDRENTEIHENFHARIFNLDILSMKIEKKMITKTSC